MKQPLITQEQMTNFLDTCYERIVAGNSAVPGCEQVAQEYLTKYKDPEVAAKKYIANQVAKCTTSGFVTSLGGFLTLPVAIPANIASVLYVQLKMIATLAVIGGYDPSEDEVQTLAYLCLTGHSIVDICKQTGVQIANKATASLIAKRLPGAVLTKINKAVGFRLITKTGSKSLITVTKLVPVAGGVVGAGVDYAGTKVIAKKAYKTFILNTIE